MWEKHIHINALKECLEQRVSKVSWGISADVIVIFKLADTEILESKKQQESRLDSESMWKGKE